jgi:hypothetical protein
MPDSKRERVKTVVKRGGGRAPGFEWHVGLLGMVFREAVDLELTSTAYEHLKQQIRDLAGHLDPTHSPTLDLRPVEDFHELKDKGGPLGRAAVRVFYGIDHAKRAIIILGVTKKQNDGKTPLVDLIRMRRRWRMYRNGEYGTFTP